MSALLGAGIAVGASIIGSLANQAGKLIDVMNAPCQVKSMGNVSSNVLMNGNIPYIEKWFIDDYEIVADTYEKTGYRVDLVQNDVWQQGFTDWIKAKGIANVRHYFNPLQLSSVTLESDINIPSGLIGDFEMRLKNGVRFWNVKTNKAGIGNFTYDNVEEAYING